MRSHAFTFAIRAVLLATSMVALLGLAVPRAHADNAPRKEKKLLDLTATDDDPPVELELPSLKSHRSAPIEDSSAVAHPPHNADAAGGNFTPEAGARGRRFQEQEERREHWRVTRLCGIFSVLGLLPALWWLILGGGITSIIVSSLTFKDIFKEAARVVMARPVFLLFPFCASIIAGGIIIAGLMTIVQAFSADFAAGRFLASKASVHFAVKLLFKILLASKFVPIYLAGGFALFFLLAIYLRALAVSAHHEPPEFYACIAAVGRRAWDILLLSTFAFGGVLLVTANQERLERWKLKSDTARLFIDLLLCSFNTGIQTGAILLLAVMMVEDVPLHRAATIVKSSISKEDIAPLFSSAGLIALESAFITSVVIGFVMVGIAIGVTIMEWSGGALPIMLPAAMFATTNLEVAPLLNSLRDVFSWFVIPIMIPVVVGAILHALSLYVDATVMTGFYLRAGRVAPKESLN